MGKNLENYTKNSNGKISVDWEKVAELIQQSDETQNYQFYDSLLEYFAEKGLLYGKNERKRHSFSLATMFNPHIAPINSKNEAYYFIKSEDASIFSEKVFKENPGKGIHILELL